MKAKIIKFIKEEKLLILMSILFGILFIIVFLSFMDYREKAIDANKPSEIEKVYLGIQQSRDKRTALQEQINMIQEKAQSEINMLVEQKKLEEEKTNQYKEDMLRIIGVYED